MAQAQSRAVVQALPDPARQRLNEALRQLSRDPRSLPGLLDAADASLLLDDVGSATGFVQRAEAIAPGDGHVKAARAQLLVRQRMPVEALRLFGEAEQVGALTVNHIADRGLAFDLIGDNIHAQQDYTLALSTGPNPLVSRRLALSQAIAGNQQASEATLLPMLQRQDLAAFRTRAFALAILGKADEAVSIADTMLPDRLSSRLGPYLRYMPNLTRAQQAAAANLGLFPQAAEIGHDDPAIAALAPQQAAPPPVRTADARLVPSGEPLGNRGGIPRRAETGTPVVRAAVQPPAQQPQPQQAAVTVVQPVPAPPPAPIPVPTPSPTPAPVQVAAVAPRELPPVAAAPPPQGPVTQPAPSPAASPPEPRDLAAAFADFSLPAGGPVAAGSEAVDITKIQPRRETPRPPAPPPKPVTPSRQWVQVATGRDLAALGFDWRRIKRSAGGLLDRNEPYVAKWGQTNRLVIGPLASAREADQLVARLKEKDVDSFRFTSAQGEEVTPLD